MIWLSDNDPVKEQAVEKKPLLEYWFLLNEKIIETKKEIARRRQEQLKGRYKRK